MVLLLNTTETGERQRNIRKEAKAIHKQMNVHRLARQKKKKTKELQQKARGHLAVSHGKHFCKLLRE
jgi:hypothetical protein